MAFGSQLGTRYGEAWDALTALVASEGTAAESHVAQLVSGDATTRDLADAVHCLCALHARHPGMVDLAQANIDEAMADAWLSEAVAAFAAERAQLIYLVAAVGPLPSTPGQAESDVAITAQHHAIDMLAGSDRTGVAIGATLALLLDWPAIRQVLDVASERAGVTATPLALPSDRDGATLINALVTTSAIERAILFGASQTLAQHRALWQLLGARAEARTAQ